MSTTKFIQEYYLTSTFDMDCTYCDNVIKKDDRYLRVLVIYNIELFINVLCNDCANEIPVALIEQELPDLDTAEANTVIIWTLEKLAHGTDKEQKLANYVMNEYGL